MQQAKKTGLIASTLREKQNNNWMQNFMDFSECSTQLGSKYISWNY